MFVRSQSLGARGTSMDVKTSWTAQGLASSITNLNSMARFQQKQLQEKEQKLLQLYDQQQQRAYQVVQKGSAGSTASNHGSSVSQHTVTRSTTTTHSTATSQGGKVRQMFDERRQTTVKGIDRSYPLEPLDNKPRKLTAGNNGNVTPKNNDGTVNRQTVTVRRVARADVNSNVNGGKPVVSYREEISREEFHGDDNEFGNENDDDDDNDGNRSSVNRNEVSIEEIIDDDTIGRNRMMAKIHLMDFDKNMKYRVNNDLESEQFPEDLMLDVPDKLPKRVPARKISQAEARLERFKNANSRRNNVARTATSTTTTTSTTRKRSEPMFGSTGTNSRVTKSPSPDPALGKSSESGTRTPAASIRRNVFSSPSKSPEVAARGSVGIKSPEPRFTKRSPTLVTKSQDVPNSSDVVDASNLQNDCQLEDFIRESKIENESTKKSDDLDTPAGESKVNGLESPKKALPRKQSAEKLVGSPKQRSPTTPTHPRPISSLSTGSTRGQTYVGGKGKMATKSKSPAHGIAASRTHSAKSSSGVSNDALTACKICGRRFAHERVTLHEQICAKTGQKKRKQFDTVMFRVKGTDLESFVKKGLSKKTIESKKKKPEVKSNWRRKHEDFINAIRSAKQVQAHLAAGGKLSDLPPPPASDTSDYVQCPHCGRKFNQGAAERHIPKCQTMLHNKPNPRAPPKPKR